MSSNVQIDNATDNGGPTFHHVTGTGAHRYLVVQVSIGPSSLAVSSITYAGVPLTSLSGSHDVHPVELWGLQDPAVGDNIVAVTMNGPGGWTAGATTFEADFPITAPAAAHASSLAGGVSTEAAVTITAAVGDLIVGGVTGSSDATLTLGETELWNDEGGDAAAAISATGGADVLSWSFVAVSAWDVAAVALRSVDAGSSSTFGSFASDLITALSTALPGYAWITGQPQDDGPEASAAVGFVWVLGSQVTSHDQLIMETTATVRVYPVQAEQEDPLTPIDPTPLYQAVDDLQAALSPVQAPVGGSPWYFQVTQVKVTHTPGQWFDATVIGTGPNSFALA